MDTNDRLRTWILNVATDDQLDRPVPALCGLTGRQVLYVDKNCSYPECECIDYEDCPYGSKSDDSGRYGAGG